MSLEYLAEAGLFLEALLKARTATELLFGAVAAAEREAAICSDRLTEGGNGG